MAYQIQPRTSLATTWTSNNPILSSGEPGVESDTGKFKIGNGSSTWTALSYAVSTGPAQTKVIQNFGDGSDGNVTINSGTTTLTRDMYYSNLTLSGTGILNTNNYKIFIKNNLDITAATVGAIQNNGTNGNNAVGATGGSAIAASAAGSMNSSGAGGSGTTATTAAGGAGGAAGAVTGNGGSTNGSGAGGTGTNAGGAAAAAVTPTEIEIRHWETSFLRGVTTLGGGASGGGGGAGGGDGVNAGGGGGSGATGGEPVVIYANNILKSSSTPAGVIQSNGGNGGNGGNSAAVGVTGGGGGGAGGAGGWVQLYYNNLFGPTINGAIQANGGTAGNGGNGFGATGRGGTGGSGGNGGRIFMMQVSSATSMQYIAVNTTSATSWVPQLIGNVSVSTAGGMGGFGQIFNVAL